MKYPFLYINQKVLGTKDSLLALKELSDIAPFILHTLKISVPDVMQKNTP